MNEAITDVAAKVWERLPSHAKVVMEKLPDIATYTDPSEEATNGCVDDGVDTGRRILINDARISNEGPEGLTWTIAHELAHCYLGTIGGWAGLYVSDTPDGWARKNDVLAALGPWNLHVPTQGTTTSDGRSSMEKLADAVGIAWGFGREYAEVVSKRLDEGTLNEDYLETHILEMVEVFAENAASGGGGILIELIKEKVFKAAESLFGFVDEFLPEKDRAAVILIGSRVEVLLGDLLKANLLPPPKKEDHLFGPRGYLSTFLAKITMATRLGIVDSNFESALNTLRRIRNSFAHSYTPKNLETGREGDWVRNLVEPIVHTELFAKLNAMTRANMEANQIELSESSIRFRVASARIMILLMTVLSANPVISLGQAPLGYPAKSPDSAEE